MEKLTSDIFYEIFKFFTVYDLMKIKFKLVSKHFAQIVGKTRFPQVLYDSMKEIKIQLLYYPFRHIKLKNANNSEVDQLLSTKKFLETLIITYGFNCFDTNTLELISKFKSLTSLHITGSGNFPASDTVSNLSNLRLRSLTLSCQYYINCIKNLYLSGQHHTLELLNLQEINLSDDETQFFPYFTKLKKLRLSYCRHISSSFTCMTCLRSIIVERSYTLFNRTHNCIVDTQKLPMILNAIFPSMCFGDMDQISIQGLEYLSKCKSLKMLEIFGFTSFSVQGLILLLNMEFLETLVMSLDADSGKTDFGHVINIRNNMIKNIYFSHKTLKYI